MKWIDGLRLRFEGRLVRALEKEVGKLTVELETARRNGTAAAEIEYHLRRVQAQFDKASRGEP